MFCCMFELNCAADRGMPTPPMNFGNPMMPNRHTRMVAAITLAFNVRFRCMKIFCLLFADLFGGAAYLFTTGSFGRYQGADRGPCELQLQVIRFDSQYYCVTIHGRNGTHDPARSNHVVAALQFAQHLRLPLLLPLHRH